MEPVVLVTIVFSGAEEIIKTYELGEESDKDVISLIQRLGKEVERKQE